jgi:hypothetical protein
VIDQYGIRSIIALNGSTPDQSWYADELAVSEAKEVFRSKCPFPPMTNFRRSICRNYCRPPESSQARAIHCKNGADRSGLAAAIYDYAIAFRPADETTGQLSIRYGHFPFLWSGSWAMDRSFKRFLIEHEERRD